MYRNGRCEKQEESYDIKSDLAEYNRGLEGDHKK